MDRRQHSRRERPGASRALARRIACGLLVTVLAGASSGCQIVIGVLMMLGGPPTIEADFKQYTKKSLADKGKKVVVLSTSNARSQSQHPSLDVDIIAEVSRRLKTQKIEVVDSHKVANWIDDHGGITDATDLAAIGPEFGADYIILFKFDDFALLEENTTNLYRGRAKGKVLVVEVTKGEGEKAKATARTIYNKPFDSKYPLHQPVSADTENPEVFKQGYLARLSEELAKLFYDHRPGEEF